jgi:hypothetical protein
VGSRRVLGGSGRGSTTAGLEPDFGTGLAERERRQWLMLTAQPFGPAAASAPWPASCWAAPAAPSPSSDPGGRRAWGSITCRAVACTRGRSEGGHPLADQRHRCACMLLLLLLLLLRENAQTPFPGRSTRQEF